MNKFKKAQRELAVEHRITELLKTHRGFSLRKLRSMALQFVEHHYGKRATREAGS